MSANVNRSCMGNLVLDAGDEDADLIIHINYNFTEYLG